METTVGKLEALFQKSEADLDYIEKRLKVDFITGATESGSSVKENPAKLLENLAAIKAKHAALSTQVKEIAAAQKETMDSIREQLDGTLHVIERFQQTADVKVQPLTVSEQEATEMVGSAVNSRGTVPSS